MKTLKTIGKVALALIGTILMPILIWVALGAAIFQVSKARKARTAPAPSFGQVLAATGLRRT